MAWNQSFYTTLANETRLSRHYWTTSNSSLAFVSTLWLKFPLMAFLSKHTLALSAPSVGECQYSMNSDSCSYSSGMGPDFVVGGTSLYPSWPGNGYSPGHISCAWGTTEALWYAAGTKWKCLFSGKQHVFFLWRSALIKGNKRLAFSYLSILWSGLSR